MNVLAISTRPRTGPKRIKTRVYIWPEGETVIQNLMARRSRPLNEYRGLLREAFRKMDVDQSRVTYRWSQKAGCGCGCSPGFIVDGWDPALDGKDVHVSVG